MRENSGTGDRSAVARISCSCPGPRAKTLRYLILLSLLLVPFGSSLVKSEWLKATTTYHWRVAEAWGFPLGVVLTSLPILIAVLFYYLWRPARCPFATGFFTWDNWTHHRPPHHDESLLAIIANKQVQRQNNRVIKTPEPTTIEFQRTFRDLLHAAARNNHRLVIVVDNLDRLPDDAALEMWTTIRSFFLGAIPVGEPTDDGPSPPVKLPSVVLPIDDSAIERIFAGKGASGGKSFADSFMEKTFDVTFHVSRPVLSDWNAYLAKQMLFGFGQAIADEWAVEVGRICEKRANGPVTPRDLNRTLNAIASLWMQWQSSGIPFSTVAYYAAMRKAFEGNLMAALASPIIDLAEHDPEWQKSLAAIHFGVPPEKGLQILLEPKLRAAISGCDHRVFGEQVRIKGFERVLYTQLDAQDFAKQSLVHLCQLLDRAGIETEDWAKLTWRRLRRIFAQSDLTETQDAALPAAFDLLMSHCPPDDRERFLLAVGQTLNVPGPQQMIIGRSTDVFRALLARWLDAASKPGVSAMPITINDPRVYLDAGAIAMVEGRPNPLIQTSAKGDDLAAALIGRVTGDQIGDVGISLLLQTTAPRPGRGRGGRQEGAGRPARSAALHPKDRNEEEEPPEIGKQEPVRLPAEEGGGRVLEGDRRNEDLPSTRKIIPSEFAAFQHLKLLLSAVPSAPDAETKLPQILLA
ncbi:P-loop NTPase fold protein [Sphingopyxis fribergensis]